jgi:hypothetical protein
MRPLIVSLLPKARHERKQPLRRAPVVVASAASSSGCTKQPEGRALNLIVFQFGERVHAVVCPRPALPPPGLAPCMVACQPECAAAGSMVRVFG